MSLLHVFISSGKPLLCSSRQPLSVSLPTTSCTKNAHLDEDIFILDDQGTNVDGTSKGAASSCLSAFLDPAGEVVGI